MRKRELELLAPAKNAEVGKIAINAGADAVYIGASDFGARKNAANGIDAIAQLAAYAHKFHARVYVTVNTLLYDHELEGAKHLIYALSEIGVDGVIVQDMALLSGNNFNIPLVASTQMHNNSKEWLYYLASIGIRRAILPREFTLREIEEAHDFLYNDFPDFELESFVHGALCVSYSGQCYLSAALSGRSGNRGECAQNCRMRYQTLDNTVKLPNYPLSLKDMCRLDDLEALISAGVTSFKVEGRLKDENYVKNVILAYNDRLNELIAGREDLCRASSGSVETNGFIPSVDKVFNRSFTSYFLHENSGGKFAFSSSKTPKMVGEYVGKVKSVKGNTLSLDNASVELNNGDGLTFFAPDGELDGMNVNRALGNELILAKIKDIEVGTELFRNNDIAFETASKNAKIERKIAVNVRILVADDTIHFAAVDEDEISAEFAVPIPENEARTPESMKESFVRQFQKSGSTIFEIEHVKLEFERKIVPFLPISELNALRKRLLDELLCARVTSMPRLKCEIHEGNTPIPRLSDTYKANILNERAREYYERHGAVGIEYAPEYDNMDMTGKEVMSLRYCLYKEFLGCKKVDGEIAAPIRLKDSANNILRVEFDCKRCRSSVILDKKAQ